MRNRPNTPVEPFRWLGRCLPHAWRTDIFEPAYFEHLARWKRAAQTNSPHNGSLLLTTMGLVVQTWVAGLGGFRPHLPIRPMVDALASDVRLARSHIRRAPLLSVMSIATLGLGLGLSATVYSVVHVVLLQPLPYTDASRLMDVTETVPDIAPEGRWAMSVTSFVAYRDEVTAFDPLIGIKVQSSTLATTNAVSRGTIVASTPEGLRTIGAEAILGRIFTEADTDRAVIVLGHAFWQRQYGSDSTIIGTPLDVDGHAHTIIGVTPPHFVFPQYQTTVDGWIPWTAVDRDENRSDFSVFGVGRLADGARLEQAQNAMSRVSEVLAITYPDMHVGRQPRVQPLQEVDRGYLRPVLHLLMGAVAFVLIVTLGKFVTLQMLQGFARRPTVALQRALGATHLHIYRQFTLETGIVSVVGGVLAVLVATAMLNLVLPLAPPWPPILHTARIDLTTAVIVLGLAVVLGTLAAVSSSHIALTVGPNDIAGGHTRRTTSAPAAIRSRQVGLVIEVCIAVVTLIGAGLIVRSITNIAKRDPGLTSANILTARINLIEERVRTSTQLVHWVDQAQQLLESHADIQQVAVADAVWRFAEWNRITLPLPDAPSNISAGYHAVTSTYFDVLDIPIVRGRAFASYDETTSQPVIVINQQFADAFFAGSDPLGQLVTVSAMGGATGEGLDVPREIIGIVGDVREAGTHTPKQPIVYVPWSQSPRRGATFIVEHRGDTGRAVASLRNTVRQLDTTLPVFGIEALSTDIANSARMHRFILTVIAGFSVVTTILAVVGIYGANVYQVQQRRHEIGIRTALGARSGHVIALVARRSMTHVALGLVLGLGLSTWLTQFLERLLSGGLLVGVGRFDPTTFGLVLGTVLFLAVCATWIPAHRAVQSGQRSTLLDAS